jgi:hypothetical protein
LNSGVVHKDIRAAEAIVNRCLQSTQILDASDVGLDGHDVVRSMGRQDGDFLCCVRESVPAQIRDADAKSELRESLGSGEADTGSTARDNGDGSGSESKVCHQLSFLSEYVAPYPVDYL